MTPNLHFTPASKRHARGKPLRPRAIPRRNVECSLAVIPVRLDQTPGEVLWTDGCTIDEPASGISMMVQRTERLSERHLVVGVSLPGKPRQFAAMAIQSQHEVDDAVRIVASPIENANEDLLSEHCLSPQIDPTRFRFCYGCDEGILQLWESLGVVRRYLVDRVLVCPGCNSVPTWRHACPTCGSARYSRERLLHHYACAHVDHGSAFESESGSLRCPKCRASRLVVGSDFEYIMGPLTCFDCQDSGGQPTLACMCHQCHERFEPDDARELELFGYHADRLNLSELAAAAR